MDTSYVLSFIEGILTFISPCILPLLPVYFFYLAGIKDTEDTINKRKLTANAIAFVLGFTIIFVLMGATATTIGQFLKNHIDILRKISGVLMIVFGLNFMGVFKIGFLNVEKRMHYNFKELNFFRSLLFGLIFGLGWTPCVGAFLGSALLMASSSNTIYEGIMLLVVYSLGLGIPFILTAVAFERLKTGLTVMTKYQNTISLISGIVLILAGLLTYTDKLVYLGALF